MYTIMIFDENVDNSNKIRDELEKNNEIIFTKIQTANTTLDSVGLLSNSVQNSVRIDIILQNIEMLKSNEVNAINILDTIMFKEMPKVILYSSNSIMKIPEIVFSDKIDFLIINASNEASLANQVVEFCRNNCQNAIQQIKLSKEEYIRTAILKINHKDRLVGYTYLFEACRICIDDHKKLALHTKKIFSEVGANCGADITTVDRSIRNFIIRGIKEDGLEAFCNYTNININMAKISSATVISGVVLGYQNMSRTYMCKTGV